MQRPYHFAITNCQSGRWEKVSASGTVSVSCQCVEESHCLSHLRLSRSPYGYGRPLVPLSASDLSLGVARQTVFESLY